MRLVPDFSRFGHGLLLEDISCHARNGMLNKIVFRQLLMYL